jgi:hypothetical protein
MCDDAKQVQHFEFMVSQLGPRGGAIEECPRLRRFFQSIALLT